MPTFTNDWFQAQAQANFEKYVKGRSGDFLEIGCCEGNATCWMLENTDADVDVIDPFPGDLRQRFEENVERFKGRVTIFEGYSQEVMQGIVRSLESSGVFYDFIYVDGAHSPWENVMADADNSLRAVKVGGLIIFDDYKLHGVRKAVDTFLIANADRVKLVEKNKQVVVEKIK